ncbi:hypothetical protein [Nocardiopsis xinjiangensis]|uniref:hypothetical protein n=1 Tax=Nocardiopsis xinjiangensis TaxID=124285 RepID=UPI000348615A|nr:hypothetical protein [Nocardiopsis xinjiangensis]
MGVREAAGRAARTTWRHYRALLTALLMPLLPALLLGALTAAALSAHGAITSGQAVVWPSLPLLTRVFAGAGLVAALVGAPTAVGSAVRVADDAARGQGPDLGRAWRTGFRRAPLTACVLAAVAALTALGLWAAANLAAPWVTAVWAVLAVAAALLLRPPRVPVFQGVGLALAGLVPLVPAVPAAQADLGLGLLWVLAVAPWTTVVLHTPLPPVQAGPTPRAAHPVPAPLLAALLATTPLITPGPSWAGPASAEPAVASAPTSEEHASPPPEELGGSWVLSIVCPSSCSLHRG